MPGDKYSPPVFPGEGIGVKDSIVSVSTPSSSVRESHRYINHGKTLCESMDFEEMESIMWRKVKKYVQSDILLTFYRLDLFENSINSVDFFKTEVNGGQVRAELPLGSGY